MPADQVKIYNLALSRLMVSTFVEDPNEDSVPARTFNAIWDLVTENVLRAHTWAFATRTAGLALVEEDPTDEWAYSYAIPADCSRVLRLVTGTRNLGTQYPFNMAYGASGTVLYCDITDPTLQYLTTDVLTASQRWPPDFASAVAWLLAAEGGMSMPGASNAAQAARQAFDRAISQAATRSLNEAVDDPEATASWLQS